MFTASLILVSIRIANAEKSSFGENSDEENGMNVKPMATVNIRPVPSAPVPPAPLFQNTVQEPEPELQPVMPSYLVSF
jgi:hypothetical protein